MFLGTKIFPEYYTSEDVIFSKIVGIDSDGKPYGYVHSGLEEDYKEKGY